MWTSWRTARHVTRVLEASRQFALVPDLDVLRASRRLQAAAREGELSTTEREQALGLLRETTRRAYNTPQYEVQIQAAWQMQNSSAVEMETGEGKKLTALMVAYLLALPGRGCHVLTANDYLAERDCEHARPVLERLGLTVDWISQTANATQRRQAYAADITFSTVTQIGFDLLRDRVGRATGQYLNGAQGPVQRPLAAAVVDEADLVMLDEARTPLLLAVAEPLPAGQTASCAWAASLAERLQPERDFVIFRPSKSVQLTEAGCRAVLLSPRTPEVYGSAESLYRRVERALEARWIYQRDQDYLVNDNKVAIIGSTTGRVLQGRQWQNGLQPAIEWKEQAVFSPQTRSNGSITIQTLLNLYPIRCGMSGTLWDDRQELDHIYQLQTVRIAPRLPSQRRRWPTRCFLSQEAKLAAIVQEVVRLQTMGRSVLVGTPSIETSDALAARLRPSGLPFEQLTARDPYREAEIVAQAGQPGAITIATNMAGRGTDIRLAEATRQAGGLHVIVAGLQASPRTDRQLIGRTARQGDPGSWQEFLSFDDELFEPWNPEAAAKWKHTIRANRDGEIAAHHRRRFAQVQRELSRRHQRQRWQLFQHQRELDRWTKSVGLDPLLEWLDEECRAA